MFNLDGFCGCPDFVWTGGLRPTDNAFNSDNCSLAPRFGFAYTLDSRGDFVMRGGYGINFQGYDAQTFEDRLGDPPRFQITDRSAEWKPLNSVGSFRSIRKTCCCISLLFRLRSLAPYRSKLRPAYAMNYTLGFQKALTSTLMLDTAYVGTRGVKFPIGRT